MATVNPTLTTLPGDTTINAAEAILYTWTLTAADNVGAAIEAHEFGDRTMQVTGTFDSATIVMEGANVATYTTLTDPQGNALSKTAAAIEAILEVPRYTRPSSSGGAGSQSVVVTMLCRRTRR
jgi:hypothetical protein